jgi:hypothetical protein
MEVHRIFEKVTDKLFAVVFDENVNQESGVATDELERVFSLWADISWLWTFFMGYRADLTEREPHMSVKNAVRHTVVEAREFYDELLRLAVSGTEDELMSLFKPLDNREDDAIPYELQMMKAKRPRSWLRLYALRYGDSYIITGGAIKLTNQMNRPHLQDELYKLRMVQKFLEQEPNEKAFVYLEI